VCSKLGIEKTFAVPRHPQTMGQVERLNQTILSMLRKRLDGKDEADWDLELPFIQFAYRTAVHAGTYDTPFHTIYGRDANTPIRMLLEPSQTKEGDEPYATTMQKRMKDCWEFVRDNTLASNERMAHYYNRNITEERITVGDLVVKQEPVQKGRNRKLAPKFDGMYRVIEIKTPNVLIQPMGKGPAHQKWVHENDLKVYRGKWVEPPVTNESRRRVKATRAFEREKAKCGGCGKEGVYGEWVNCDACRQWFHFACVGLKRAPKTVSWICPTCREDTGEEDALDDGIQRDIGDAAGSPPILVESDDADEADDEQGSDATTDSGADME
jgi:hypothetical protein